MMNSPALYSDGARLKGDDDASVALKPIPYEKQLADNPRWALSESSLYFDEKGAVQQTLRKITQRLNDLNIPYAVVGGLALFQHGHRRFTEDVDLLVTKAGLKSLHAALEGLGYVPPFKGSKHLRDVEHGVKVEFLTTGDFPGDGKPKPVAFPEPTEASFEVDGIKYLNLTSLIELKLASGMTNAGRLKDLADVIELIKVLDPPREFSQKLNPYVQPKFMELWENARRRFVMTWRNKFLTVEAESLDEMIVRIKAAAAQLEAMKSDGVILDPSDSTADDCALLSTDDPKIAAKYGMVEESELWLKDNDENHESI